MTAIESKDLLGLTPQVRVPSGSWRATMLSHPCARQQWYHRYRADTGEPMPEKAQMRLEIGNQIEDGALSAMAKAGWTVAYRQTWVYGTDIGLPDTRGRIDAVLVPPEGREIEGVPPGSARICEVKSMKSWAFAKIHTLQDLIESENWWMRGYPVQLGLYMVLWAGNFAGADPLNVDTEAGWLLIVDAGSGQMRLIEVPFEGITDQVDAAIERGRALHELTAASEESELPDQVEYSAVCEMCAWRVHCRGREIHEKPLDPLTGDPKLRCRVAELLRIRADSEPGKKLWSKADTELKKTLVANHVERALVDGWICESKQVEVHRRAQDAKVIQQTRWTIKEMGDETGID